MAICTKYKEYRISILMNNRIDGMQSVQNNFRINTWPQYSPICNLPPHEKDRKENKLGVFIPHLLGAKNREDCVSIATSLSSRQKNDSFLKNIITGNQKLVFHDKVQHKRQIDKDESLQLTLKVKLNRRKDILCIRWNHRSIIHFDTQRRFITLNNCNVCMNIISRRPLTRRLEKKNMIITQVHIK